MTYVLKRGDEIGDRDRDNRGGKDATSQGKQSIITKYQKLEEARKDSPIRLQMEHGPAFTLISDFQPLDL